MSPFVDQLHFPTSLAFGDDGTLYVTESGLPFGGAPAGGSVSRIRPDGVPVRLAGGLRAPVNGLLWHAGALIVSEGGNPGRISRLDPASGRLDVILDGLPGLGNYHTNMAVAGPDRKLYFSQGAMTNSGVIGLDSSELPWLGEVEHNCDIPGYAVTLDEFAGVARHPAHGDGQTVRTGAFAPFGTVRPRGTRLAGKVPCTAAVMRCDLDGGNLELVAWGLRNAFGMGFLADGRLLATDQGADARGVRPIANCPDFLHEVVPGAWYGWPDFYGGTPATDPRFRGTAAASPGFVLQNHAELPPPRRALLEFEVNACPVKFTQIPAGLPFAGDLVVAQFGDERPMAGPPGPRVGRNLVRVATADWSLHALPPLPFSRPIDVAFAAHEAALYVADFGAFEIEPDKRIAATAASGRIWKLPAHFLEGIDHDDRIVQG